MKRIPYASALVNKSDILEINKAAKIGWGNKHSYFIQKFEESFRKKFNIKYSIATSSCTGAIMLALMSLGVKKGDEVILSDINWISPASIIKILGARCIFADINSNDWCIDPKSIEKKITKKTKVIIATHLYGNTCRMNEIKKIGKKHNIYILEDAAEAIGSKVKNKFAGTLGEIGVFSFHGTKTITTGEGGMLVTNNKKIFNKALLLSNSGRPINRMKDFRAIVPGIKFKMTNIQAALGISQLKRFNSIIRKKIEIFNKYKANLNQKFITMNHKYEGDINSYWMPTIVFDKSLNLNKKYILKKLSGHKIDGRPFFDPLSSLSFLKKANNPVSYDISKRAINLPSFLNIKDQEIKKITKIINDIIISKNVKK